jgi:hypothetical protein
MCPSVAACPLGRCRKSIGAGEPSSGLAPTLSPGASARLSGQLSAHLGSTGNSAYRTYAFWASRFVCVGSGSRGHSRTPHGRVCHSANNTSSNACSAPWSQSHLAMVRLHGSGRITGYPRGPSVRSPPTSFRQLALVNGRERCEKCFTTGSGLET